MKREMMIEWSTEYTELEDGETLETKLKLTSDDDNTLWLTFENGANIEYVRMIPKEDIVKLSRFFYDAADFIKRDS